MRSTFARTLLAITAVTFVFVSHAAAQSAVVLSSGDGSHMINVNRELFEQIQAALPPEVLKDCQSLSEFKNSVSRQRVAVNPAFISGQACSNGCFGIIRGNTVCSIQDIESVSSLLSLIEEEPRYQATTILFDTLEFLRSELPTYTVESDMLTAADAESANLLLRALYMD